MYDILVPPTLSAGSPHRRKRREFNRVYGTATVNNLLAISVSRLSIFPFRATVPSASPPPPRPDKIRPFFLISFFFFFFFFFFF